MTCGAQNCSCALHSVGRGAARGSVIGGAQDWGFCDDPTKDCATPPPGGGGGMHWTGRDFSGG